MKKIFKGCHYCWSFLIPRIYFKSILSKDYVIKFDESARYDIGVTDQSDVNKLFGFGYGVHHIDSDRFGWRYNIQKEQIEIVEYCYEAGSRLATKHVSWLNIGEEAKMSIRVRIDKDNLSRTTEYFFRTTAKEVRYEKTYKLKKKWLINYSLGLYFGGNIAAPHKITVEMK